VRLIFDALIEVLHSLDEKIAMPDAEISRRAAEVEDTSTDGRCDGANVSRSPTKWHLAD
jgi:hypothetical protein